MSDNSYHILSYAFTKDLGITKERSQTVLIVQQIARIPTSKGFSTNRDENFHTENKRVDLTYYNPWHQVAGMHLHPLWSR